MAILLNKMEYKEMINVIDRELDKRKWGIREKRRGKRPFYYILDYRALGLVTGIIRYCFENNDVRIFYRGQRRNWPLIPSLYRNCQNGSEIKAANKWREEALAAIATCFDKDGKPDEREALAQHYGLKTQLIDVADNIQTALWFAYDECKGDEFSSEQGGSVGYIHVIAVPSKEADIIDLRRKPSEWLRPHVQQGFSVRFHKPEKKKGDRSEYIIATFVLHCLNLRLWSNYDNIPHEYFYPYEETDRGLYYWNEAKKILTDKGLINKEGNAIWHD